MATKLTKNMTQAVAKVDRTKRYTVEAAVGLLKNSSFAKFDESVDVAVRLGVNPKHADQMVRGAIVLPHGTGKSVKVLVFARGDKEKEAKEAGADHSGGDAVSYTHLPSPRDGLLSRMPSSA